MSKIGRQQESTLKDKKVESKASGRMKRKKGRKGQKKQERPK